MNGSAAARVQARPVPVNDVASYILRKAGAMPAMRLHRLAYYGQAWSLVWDDAPLFGARIEAWAIGPIVPAIYVLHRGAFEVDHWHGDPESLTEIQRETVDAVLDYYGGRPTAWLGQLARRERPWQDARHGLAAGEHGSEEITHAAMADYYGGLMD